MKKIILSVFLILSLSLIFYYVNNLKNTEIITCPISIKIVTVNGLSMSPFLNSGQEVIALYNYYDCNEVLRNDVVLYKYSGNSNLLIKFVKAIPGDKWSLEKTDSGYKIIINDVFLVNSESSPYLIPEGSIKMLELYAEDYPIIPADTYLLLGDKTDGSLDSTSFGLVGKKDIIAKVRIAD
jgi:signal peptidase I